jgi:hypothetical protein
VPQWFMIIIYHAGTQTRRVSEPGIKIHFSVPECLSGL